MIDCQERTRKFNYLVSYEMIPIQVRKLLRPSIDIITSYPHPPTCQFQFTRKVPKQQEPEIEEGNRSQFIIL